MQHTAITNHNMDWQSEQKIEDYTTKLYKLKLRLKLLLELKMNE